jgi:hypothetical protein
MRPCMQRAESTVSEGLPKAKGNAVEVFILKHEVSSMEMRGRGIGKRIRFAASLSSALFGDARNTSGELLHAEHSIA